VLEIITVFSAFSARLHGSRSKKNKKLPKAVQADLE